MNGRASKAKGYTGEVEFIQVGDEEGYPGLRRNGNQFGQADQGDIAGVIGWVIQVKNVATARIPEWIRACKEQAKNAGVDRWAIALKLRGHHMRDGVVMVPTRLFFEMVRIIEAFEKAEVDEYEASRNY